LAVRFSLFVTSGEVPRGEKTLYFGTDTESFITEYTVVYEDESLTGFSGAWFWPTLRVVCGDLFSQKIFIDYF
jgi:hypothetical protein